MRTTIKVGDTVSWSGSFGTDDPKEVTIEEIERTSRPHEKYGVEVGSVDFIDGEWEFPFVCTVSTGNWAYSEQVRPSGGVV